MIRRLARCLGESLGVGKRGRSAFLTEVARDEIQRRQQRNALHAAKGAWKDEDHPTKPR